MPAYSASTNSKPVETLDVTRAKNIIQKFTDDPSWLADPRTASVANGIFNQASKVLGMHLQMERLQSQSEAALARNSITKEVAKSLLKMAESGPEGAGVAARWYALGDDGKPLYENPANASAIFQDYSKHSLAKDVQPKPITIEMEDGTKINAIYNPQTGSHHVVKSEADIQKGVAEKEKTNKVKILTSEASGLEKKYIQAKADLEQASASDAKGKNKDEIAGLQAKMNTYLHDLNRKRGEIESLQAPAKSAPTEKSPYPDGTRLTDNAGKVFVVKDGQPVPE